MAVDFAINPTNNDYLLTTNGDLVLTKEETLPNGIFLESWRLQSFYLYLIVNKEVIMKYINEQDFNGLFVWLIEQSISLGIPKSAWDVQINKSRLRIKITNYGAIII